MPWTYYGTRTRNNHFFMREQNKKSEHRKHCISFEVRDLSSLDMNVDGRHSRWVLSWHDQRQALLRVRRLVVADVPTLSVEARDVWERNAFMRGSSVAHKRWDDHIRGQAHAVHGDVAAAGLEILKGYRWSTVYP